MKRILLLLSIFITTMTFAQTKVTAPLQRNNLADISYGTHYDSLGYGGLVTFTSLTSRDAYPISLRRRGMIAIVQDTLVFQLIGAYNNANWTPVYFGSRKIDSLLSLKQNNLTLTTTGSGAATLVGNTINIPVSAGSGTWGSITGTLSSQTDLNSALNAKAPIASPGLTGVPTAPTAATTTNTTQLATTAFVQQEITAQPKVYIANDATNYLQIFSGTSDSIGGVTAAANLVLRSGNAGGKGTMSALTYQDIPLSLTTTGSGAATYIAGVLNVPISSGGSTGGRFTTNGYGTIVDSSTANLYRVIADTNTTAKLRDVAINSKLNTLIANAAYGTHFGFSADSLTLYLIAANGTKLDSSKFTGATAGGGTTYTGTSPVVVTGSVISLTTVPIANGGTNATTANTALNNLLPTQTSNTGKVLSTDGANTSWITSSGGGASGGRDTTVPVWNRRGVVLNATLTSEGSNTYEPSVILEGSPQILTGLTKVFKMWFTTGWNTRQVNYAESADGISWTKYASNPVVPAHSRSFVLKNGSTYYMYAVNTAQTQLDRFTSSDGIVWTLATSNILGTGTFLNCSVIVDGSTWRMLIDGTSGSGYVQNYYTSPDGITWTAYASNPVMSGTGLTSQFLKKIGSTYYVWLIESGSAATLPSDLYRWSSINMITWTRSSPIPIFPRRQADEGPQTSVGQVADPFLLAVDSSVYLFYAASKDGSDSASRQQIKLAIANMPFDKLILNTEGDGADVINNNTPSTAWSKTGDFATDSAINFIGTTDPRPFDIRTNNIRRMHISSVGQIFTNDISTGSADTHGTYYDVNTTDGSQLYLSRPTTANNYKFLTIQNLPGVNSFNTLSLGNFNQILATGGFVTAANLGADRINITNDATISGDIILNRNSAAGRLLRFTEQSTSNNALLGQNNTSGFNGLSIRMNNSTSMITGTQVMGFWNDATGIVMGPQTTRTPSAQLDMQSTTQGFAPPRMTTTQRNAITSGVFSGTIAGGSGYTNGTYTANALTGGAGTGATATITVAGGIVTNVVIVAQGSGYAIGNVLSTSGIGAGTGFTYTITTLTGAEGLVVYDLTLHKLYGYDGTAWFAAW